MKMTYVKMAIAAGLGAAVVATAGCWSKEGPQWQPETERKYFRVSTRQLPPEKVYNPLRFVRPPQVAPTRRTEASIAPLFVPVSRFEVNAPLREAILTFAAISGYRSYCSSLVADRHLALQMLGTMDEIGAVIEQKTQIQVVIDHHNKEVRFLAKNFVAPELAEEQAQGGGQAL